MSVAFRFQKNYAEKVLDALRNGRPILPLEATGWTLNNILVVAGILHAAAIAGAAAHTFDETGEGRMDDMHPEQREAVGETLRAGYAAALDFLGMLAMKVLTDEYDQEYPPEVTAVVHETPDGAHEVLPGQGENE
jgi:hypothetical protein